MALPETDLTVGIIACIDLNSVRATQSESKFLP